MDLEVALSLVDMWAWKGGVYGLGGAVVASITACNVCTNSLSHTFQVLQTSQAGMQADMTKVDRLIYTLHLVSFNKVIIC